MGGFEDVFGVGADATSIIDAFSTAHMRELREAYRDGRAGRTETLKATFSKTFSTFTDASDWAKAHPGCVISREPNGPRFVIKD